MKKPLIDPVFEKAFLIENVTDSIKVEHHKYWAPPFVSKRDMCVRLNKARLDDGSFCHLLGAGEPKRKEKNEKERTRWASGADVIGGGWLRAAEWLTVVHADGDLGGGVVEL